VLALGVCLLVGLDLAQAVLLHEDLTRAHPVYTAAAVATALGGSMLARINRRSAAEPTLSCKTHAADELSFVSLIGLSLWLLLCACVQNSWPGTPAILSPFAVLLWMHADSLSAAALLCLAVRRAASRSRRAAGILLHGALNEAAPLLADRQLAIRRLPGLIRIQNEIFWALDEHRVVGSLTAVLQPGENKECTKQKIHSLLGDIVFKLALTAVYERDE